MVKTIVTTVITILIGILFWWLFLPAMSLSNPGFYGWLFGTLLCGTIVAAIADYIVDYEWGTLTVVYGIATVAVLLILAIGAFFGSGMFHSAALQDRLDVTETTFEETFTEVDWNSVPQIDKASAQVLGKRVLGTLVKNVSQFNDASTYTQVNLNGRPVRISPLDYAGFFKYQSNKYNGIPGYVAVDCVSKEAEYVELEDGMQYSPGAFFGKDLKRRLRSQYPGTLFSEESFEKDDEGNTYWVIPTYRYAAGIGGVKTPTGAIVLDPFTGKSEKYDIDEIPEWIDSSVDETLAVEMIDSWGKYKNGFWNAHFAQKEVVVSTDGYNYITMGDDVYLYTGITSVALDESNIGFMLVNMRTAKGKYFTIPSAEEYSAMDAATNKIAHLQYNSTFPVLINLQGIPTYFMTLKDSAGLVKMNALVSVSNIQIVAVTDINKGIDGLIKEYLEALNFTETVNNTETKTVTITVKELYTASIEGNTYYYIVNENGTLYFASITAGKHILPLVKVGDTLTVTGVETNNYFNVTQVVK